MLRRIGCILTMVMIVTAVRAQTKPTQTRPSPKVVCFGDSITQQGYPQQLGRELALDVVNAGVGGNSSAAGLKRLQKDVLDQKPAVVVILFGTNDTRLDAPKVHVPLDQYVMNLTSMAQACRKVGAKVVICTIPPINAEAYFKRHERDKFDAAGGLEAVLDRYRDAARALAKKNKLAVVDLAERLEKRPEWLSEDGVHPSDEGRQILADEIGTAVELLLEKE